MEALDFIDVDVVWFVGLSLIFLTGYWSWKIMQEYKGMQAAQAEKLPPFGVPELPVLTEQIPLPIEPVGMTTAEFLEQDKQEVEVVQEVVATMTPYPMPTIHVTEPEVAAVYPMPVVEAPLPVTRTIEGPFISYSDLVAFLHETKCQAAVNLDNKPLQGGFGPALEYATEENGSGLIRRKHA